MICIDTGTTNTRVWLLDSEGRIVARAQQSVGVRDTARQASLNPLKNTLRELIQDMRSKGASGSAPAFVVAAGMITSAQGLHEIAHLPAPAGLAQLARAVECRLFPEITDLPIYFVPGVRCGPREKRRESVLETDLIRGEETLCVGLLELGLLKPLGTLLNLGSHWKAIHLDGSGCIARSTTSLSGELTQAVQTQTILSSAVPHERPDAIEDTWMQAGMQEMRRSGLARALFCVRLLEQAGQGTPEDRLSFLIGALTAADLDPLLSQGLLEKERDVVIAGSPALAKAWCRVLAEKGIPAKALATEVVEAAFLTGLRAIVTPAS